MVGNKELKLSPSLKKKRIWLAISLSSSTVADVCVALMLYTCCRLQLASFDKVDAASFGQKAKLMFRRRILKHRGMPLERAGYELTVLVLSSPSSVLLSG